MAVEIAYLADFPDLVPTIARWQQEQWAFLSPDRTLHDRVQEIEATLHRRQAPMTLVALDGAQLLGAASLTLDGMETHTEFGPWLTNLYVEEVHRNQGVAQTLIGQIIENARALGYAEIYLFSYNGRELYQSLGFEEISVESYRQRETTVFRRPISFGAGAGAPGV